MERKVSTGGSETAAAPKGRLAWVVAMSLIMSTAVLMHLSLPAYAGAGLAITPTFPATVTVGDTGTATLSIVNNSTAPENDDPIRITSIGLVPSCGAEVAPCATNDPGVFNLGDTGSGQAGTACAGVTFTISAADPSGLVSFTSPSPVDLGNSQAGGAQATCVIAFTFSVAKVPSLDAVAGTGGVQTRAEPSVVGVSTLDSLAVATARGSQPITVNQMAPTTSSTTSTSSTSTSSTVAPTSTSSTVTSSTVAPTSSTSSTTTSTVRPATAATTTTLARALPRTGSDTAQLALVAVVLMIMGSRFVTASGRRRGPWRT